MSTPLDNPAGRLCHVLTEARELGSVTIDQAIRRVYGLEEAEQWKVLRASAEILQWAEDARQQIRALPDVNHHLYLGWDELTRNALAFLTELGRGVGEMLPHYNTATLVSLAHSADLLHTRAAEPTIEDDQLDGLIALAQQMMQQVLNDKELPPEARLFVYDKIRAVEQALIHFKVYGYEGVQDAMDRLLGGMSNDQNLWMASAG